MQSFISNLSADGRKCGDQIVVEMHDSLFKAFAKLAEQLSYFQRKGKPRWYHATRMSSNDLNMATGADSPRIRVI